MSYSHRYRFEIAEGTKRSTGAYIKLERPEDGSERTGRALATPRRDDCCERMSRQPSSARSARRQGDDGDTRHWVFCRNIRNTD
eukprot:204269-Pleurochrysis_carterae.AAC.2